jgi:hypothetical protein
MKLKVPVSAGEIVDKATILEIKVKRINDPAKVFDAVKELKELSPAVKRILSASKKLPAIKKSLFNINCKLWDIENSIRSLESKKNFGIKFVKLARSVYISNDKRARLKNQINKLSGSKISEVKEYSKYN